MMDIMLQADRRDSGWRRWCAEDAFR